MTTITYLAIFALAVYSFIINKSRAVSLAKFSNLHSQPYYHGIYSAVFMFLPAITLLILWTSIQNILTNLTIKDYFGDINDPGLVKFYINSVIDYSSGVSTRVIEHSGFLPAVERYSSLTYTNSILKIIVAIGLSVTLLRLSMKTVTVEFKAREYVERLFVMLMKLSSIMAIVVTVGIVLSLLFETLRFFSMINIFDFLFGLQWSPQTAIRADQVASSGSFGAIPVFVGTILISLIAMLVAVPIGLYSAIYLSQYAPYKVRTLAKPIIEILAGIPTVVYGFFAVITVAPFFRDLGDKIAPGALSGESAIIAGTVMGIMIIPFITSLTDDAMNAVPSSLKEGSLAMGATVSETTKQVIIPASFHGIVASFLLAFSRAIGETMIVVMAAGFAANLTLNPFESVTTVTVQIVGLLTGDQEFDSAKTLSAFALAFVLFFLTLILNVIALNMVKKYRELYE